MRTNTKKNFKNVEAQRDKSKTHFIDRVLQKGIYGFFFLEMGEGFSFWKWGREREREREMGGGWGERERDRERF